VVAGKELIVTARSLPTRTLPAHPDLRQLKRQAKALLDGFIRGDDAAVAEVTAHYHNAEAATFALHDAQLVIARAYGFESWPRLKASVQGVTIERLTDAVRARDLRRARAMLRLRPELAHKSADFISPLHHAVVNGDIEMVRVLMAHGANPHGGVYPYRETTGALTLARERGLADIVAVIEKYPPSHEQAGAAGPPGGTVSRSARDSYDAAARGDVEWFRARAAQGALENPIEDFGGCLTVAARHDRIEVVRLLLDLGFDPNERTRFRSVGGDGVVFNWGMPLWQCAAAGRYEIAGLLLERGADPNADVYASGTPVMQAHQQRDQRMVALLEQYGGVVDAATAGAYGLVDRARVLLAGPQEDPPRASVAAQLLLEGAGGGHEEIVRLALERIDWPRDDARWFGVLEQPPRRATGAGCFRLVLARADPNVRGRGPFGLTILHRVAGSPDRVPAGMTVAFATMLLDAGARLDVRDYLLESTPLGWACRWQRPELVRLFLERGADPLEANAPQWARPMAWAAKNGDPTILELLRK
jgi:ankyrin repeat protein